MNPLLLVREAFILPYFILNNFATQDNIYVFFYWPILIGKSPEVRRKQKWKPLESNFKLERCLFTDYCLSILTSCPYRCSNALIFWTQSDRGVRKCVFPQGSSYLCSFLLPSGTMHLLCLPLPLHMFLQHMPSPVFSLCVPFRQSVFPQTLQEGELRGGGEGLHSRRLGGRQSGSAVRRMEVSAPGPLQGRRMAAFATPSSTPALTVEDPSLVFDTWASLIKNSASKGCTVSARAGMWQQAVVKQKKSLQIVW